MLTIYYKCCLSISTLYYNFSKPRGTPAIMKKFLPHLWSYIYLYIESNKYPNRNIWGPVYCIVSNKVAWLGYLKIEDWLSYFFIWHGEKYRPYTKLFPKIKCFCYLPYFFSARNRKQTIFFVWPSLVTHGLSSCRCAHALVGTYLHT